MNLLECNESLSLSLSLTHTHTFTHNTHIQMRFLTSSLSLPHTYSFTHSHHHSLSPLALLSTSVLCVTKEFIYLIFCRRVHHWFCCFHWFCNRGIAWRAFQSLYVASPCADNLIQLSSILC